MVKMKKRKALLIIKKVLLGGVYGFAIFGFVLTAAFFAVKFHFTDVIGAVDPHSDAYTFSSPTALASVSPQSASSSTNETPIEALNQDIDQLKLIRNLKIRNVCALEAVASVAPANAKMISVAALDSDVVMSKMIFAVALRLRENQAFQEHIDACNEMEPEQFVWTAESVQRIQESTSTQNVFPWAQAQYWSSIQEAIRKDEQKILAASSAASLDPRLLTAPLVVEQFRLYYTQREAVEKVLQPLKILANATQFAWGVMSMKEDTAIQVEEHLKDSNSPYYLGAEYEHLLDFKTADHDKERYARIANEKDHSYAYLYGALYIKQLMQQWKAAGYDISDRPEILTTLYNIGFSNSQPNTDPEVGGSTIEIEDHQYSFGSLGYEYYYSGEMDSAFPVQ